MTTTSRQLEPNLFLVNQVVQKTFTVPAPTSVNHIAVIDCSGSMSSDLPKIREQLKRRLPKLLREGDTLSLIWFSGRGQFGALIEAEPVAGLADLNDVNKAIDRWLKPVGMTGFQEPLLEVKALTERISKKNPNPFALFFMSDGCDNQGTRLAVLGAVEQIAPKLSSATFVEYGYYADRTLLAAMANVTGGSLIFAEAFDKYEPMFETAMAKQVLGGNHVEVKIEGDPISGFAWAIRDGEITTYISEGTVTIGPDVTDLWYLSPTKIGRSWPSVASKTTGNSEGVQAMYAAMSLFAVRMKPDIVYPLLRATGDVALIDQFSTCFGKQAYSAFMEATRLAVFNEGLRLTKGYDPSRVPSDDAFTVLDLIDLLANDDKTRLLLDHPAFTYSRVSRGRVEADENLSAVEADQLEDIRTQMAGEKSAKKLKELQSELDQLLAAKRDALKFVPDPASDGYPINGLVYNENRPNISLRVQKSGKVNLSSRIGAAADDQLTAVAKIPPIMSTFIYRNYTIVKDGLVNIAKLPVLTSNATLAKLFEAGVNFAPNPLEPSVIVIDVASLPILNRKKVQAVSAEVLLSLEWGLIKRQAEAKVLNYYQKHLFPQAKSKGWVEQYGVDGMAWLKDQGFTEYSGFSPRMVQAESTDVYMGKELKVKIKGYSSLPKVEDVQAQLGGKLTGPAKLMAPLITAIEAARIDKDIPFIDVTQACRRFQRQIADIKFGVIVGQVWFREFASLDDNTLTITTLDGPITATFELKEIEIKI